MAYFGGVSMFLKRLAASLLLALPLSGIPIGLVAQTQQTQGITESTSAQPVLWRQPENIATRDLFYGPGGKANAPEQLQFTFVKEDNDGSNPKFDVRDSKGTLWKVKLGTEARPETVATRLVWAVGYHADEDYLLQEATIAEMPTRLKRGQDFVNPGGVIHNGRFERVLQGQRRVGEWRWKKNPHTGTRELNGLRVVMALINNWDLKDSNNTVVEDDSGDRVGLPNSGGQAQVFLISDLGATFGSPGFSWPHSKSRGNLKAFAGSKFINRVTDQYVDFKAPARPALIRAVALPDFIGRLKIRWLGRRIPRTDVQWISELLGQLSSKQIRDAFRAAGYGPDEVEGYSRVIESRIADLKKL
jgi:hypothetical protein